MSSLNAFLQTTDLRGLFVFCKLQHSISFIPFIVLLFHMLGVIGPLFLFLSHPLFLALFFSHFLLSFSTPLFTSSGFKSSCPTLSITGPPTPLFISVSPLPLVHYPPLPPPTCSTLSSSSSFFCPFPLPPAAFPFSSSSTFSSTSF